MKAKQAISRDLPNEGSGPIKATRNFALRSILFLGALAQNTVSGILQAAGYTVGTTETVPVAGKAVTVFIALLGWTEDEINKGRMGALKGSAKRRIRRAYRKLVAQGAEATMADVRKAIKGLPIPDDVIETVIARAIHDEDEAQAKKASKSATEEVAAEAATA